MSRSSRAYARARKALRAIEIKDGDILAVKEGSIYAQKHNIEGLAKVLGETGKERCIVLVVEDLDSMRGMNEEAMNKHGWYKENENDNDKNTGEDSQ